MQNKLSGNSLEDCHYTCILWVLWIFKRNTSWKKHLLMLSFCCHYCLTKTLTSWWTSAKSNGFGSHNSRYVLLQMLCGLWTPDKNKVSCYIRANKKNKFNFQSIQDRPSDPSGSTWEQIFWDRNCQMTSFVREVGAKH